MRFQDVAKTGLVFGDEGESRSSRCMHSILHHGQISILKKRRLDKPWIRKSSNLFCNG
jgi:hypothetical protein